MAPLRCPRGGTWEWIPYLCGFSYRLGLNHLEVTFLYIFLFLKCVPYFQDSFAWWNIDVKSLLPNPTIYTVVIKKTLTKQMLLLVMHWFV